MTIPAILKKEKIYVQFWEMLKQFASLKICNNFGQFWKTFTFFSLMIIRISWVGRWLPSLLNPFLGPFFQRFEGHLNVDTVLRPEIWSSPLGRTRPTTLCLKHTWHKIFRSPASVQCQNYNDKKVPGVAWIIRNCATTNLVGGWKRATIPTSSPGGWQIQIIIYKKYDS